MKSALLLTVCFSLVGCKVTGGRWVIEGEQVCRSGLVTTERRITDTSIHGRVRNTIERTNTCLD